jgi:hypothetical protein
MGATDITLRHVTRRRPEELARAYVDDGPLRVVGWVDTQITAVERRADKALRLLVAGEPRVLHVEFCYRLGRNVPDLMFEYLGLLFVVLRAEAPKVPVPLIDSVAIVLTGRKRPLPAEGRRRTSWPNRRFSGTRFRIDAIYQCTVAEIRARGSVLWRLFTPLARDATADLVREDIAALCAGATCEEERAELLAALFVMATLDPWGHDMRYEVMMMLDEQQEIALWRRVPVIGDMITQAEKLGRAEGREEVLAEMLGRLFVRRAGRTPTAGEQRSLVERAAVLGAGNVEDTLLDLEGESVVRWLAEPLPR